MEVLVNGTVIPEREIARETQHHPAPSLDIARRKAAQALVVRALLLQQADRLRIADDHETDEQRIAALIEREVKTPSADEAACRRYYHANTARFRSPDL